MPVFNEPAHQVDPAGVAVQVPNLELVGLGPLEESHGRSSAAFARVVSNCARVPQFHP